MMTRPSRQQRREEKDRAYKEHEAAIRAQEDDANLQIAAKRTEDAKALLNAGPEELALMAAAALINADQAMTVYQEIAWSTRATALSNLAIFSAMGARAGQPE